MTYELWNLDYSTEDTGIAGKLNLTELSRLLAVKRDSIGTHYPPYKVALRGIQSMGFQEIRDSDGDLYIAIPGILTGDVLTSKHGPDTAYSIGIDTKVSNEDRACIEKILSKVTETPLRFWMDW